MWKFQSIDACFHFLAVTLFGTSEIQLKSRLILLSSLGWQLYNRVAFGWLSRIRRMEYKFKLTLWCVHGISRGPKSSSWWRRNRSVDGWVAVIRWYRSKSSGNKNNKITRHCPGMSHQVPVSVIYSLRVEWQAPDENLRKNKNLNFNKIYY